jgi:hypothetical protein
MFRRNQEGVVTPFFPKLRISNVKRPTKNISSDYFNSNVEKPEPGVKAPPVRRNALIPANSRNVREFNPRESRENALLPLSDDPAIQERAQALLDAHFGGTRPVVAQRIADGAMNLEVKIMQGANGKRYFLKRVRPDDFEAEILNNRLALALGITDIVMVDAGDRATLLMDVAPGKMARDNMAGARKVLGPDFNSFKNAKLIGLMDFLNGNGDRHVGNWFVAPNGEPIPIDHGLARFDGQGYSPFATKVWGDADGGRQLFTKAELEALRGNINGIRNEFEALGMELEYRNVVDLMNVLIDRYGY